MLVFYRFLMEDRKKLSLKRILLSIITIFVFIIIVGFIVVLFIYNSNLSAVSSSDAKKEVEILKGMTSRNIASLLKEYNLIKDENTFLVYLKLNKVDDLKFGTYLFSENMGVESIVEYLQNGSKYNPDEVVITIQEGLNMRKIAEIISSKTSNSYDSVIEKSNDKEYIKTLIDKYWFITDDILNDQLYYKLEGYLFPDTYSLTNKDVSVEYIFNKMINEMAKKLEPYKDYDYGNLSIHERLSLASMVEKEAAKESDRSLVASVFINRINKGMSLGSDVTTRYAVKLDNPKQALTKKQYNTKSPYNTRLTDGSMNGKLPVGPICTLSKSSIDAAFNPEESNYLYFIANIQTLETFFYDNSGDFEKKKAELSSVNNGF